MSAHYCTGIFFGCIWQSQHVIFVGFFHGQHYAKAEDSMIKSYPLSLHMGEPEFGQKAVSTLGSWHEDQ